MKKSRSAGRKAPPSDPAATLREDAASWGQRLCNEYQITDSGGKMLVDVAVAALIRLRQAEALIAEHGTVQVDRFGMLKSNPALVVERDSRSGLLSALRQLHLDIEPLQGIGRPPNR